jgi:hypothetical protein
MGGGAEGLRTAPNVNAPSKSRRYLGASSERIEHGPFHWTRAWARLVTIEGNNLHASSEGGDGNDLTVTVVP